MNKNEFAPYPPMGWNSYDYYDTAVTEQDIRANAEYMAKNLKQYGWEYIIVDIAWYAHNSGTQRDQYQYIPFDEVEMDEYSRLFPDPVRFPSAKNGAGFKPLADYVHSLGLKFGIHIMRGIPRIAAHLHTPILGSDNTANQIANAYSICPWNPDMYGLEINNPASQVYYDSIFQLYASWGVDFVKCDDICNYGKQQEIPMLHKAIQNSGRAIVLSLSPGPAKIETAWHYEKYANMWRITDDFWDSWPLLLNMFDRCEQWEHHVEKGCYPDCDMLPLGRLGKGFNEERSTRFTKEEQITMMTLWCIFRSPLMLGCELTLLDEWTKELISNADVLSLLKTTKEARQLEKDEAHAIWYTMETNGDAQYIALFNLQDQEQEISYSFENTINSKGIELWTQTEYFIQDHVSVVIPPHGAKLIKF